MLHHFLRATRSNSQDPYFKQVALLLHGDGTNGAQNNTFIDSSSNNISITRNGNTTQGTFTPYSQPAGYWSSYFSGTNKISIANNAALNLSNSDFTIECWMYLASSPTVDARVFEKSVTSTEIQMIVKATTRLVNFQYTTNGINIFGFTSVSAVPVNTWTHVAVTRNGSTWTIWINGVADVTYTSSNTIWSGTEVLLIANRNGGDRVFPGYLSNLRIVKGTSVYNSTFTPPTTPLTAITNTSLLILQSYRYVDNSSNNFALTLTGTPPVTAFSPFAPTTAYSTSTVGGSGYFDGSGDYLRGTANSAFAFGTGDFTVEYWLYPLSFSTSPTIFDTRIPSVSGSVNGYSDYFDTSGNFKLWIGNTNIYTSATSVKLSSWTHIAITRSGTSLRVFLNGVQSGSTVTNSTNMTDNQCLVGVNVGTTAGSVSTGYFNGYMSNLRALKGTALYTSNFTPPTTPLTNISNTSFLLNYINAGIFDSSAKNDCETVGNAQVSTSVTKFGTGSMAFDGTGDWLTFPDRPELQLQAANFTVEAWVYLSATGSARGIVGKGTATTGWLLSTNSSNQVVFTDGSSTITSTGTLSGSTWYHIAVVRSGTSTNQTKIYINGVNDGTGTVSTTYNQTNIMYVGADRTGGSAMNGYIDDLRITNGIARYTTNFTPPQGPYPNQ